MYGAFFPTRNSGQGGLPLLYGLVRVAITLVARIWLHFSHLACPSMKNIQSGLANKAPVIGAIRWDAWHGERGGPGRAVENALGPKEWHSRLPFFAQVIGEDKVRIDGSTQSVMDREIEYAHQAGLDYWAFVAYGFDDPMSLGLKRYLSSPKRNKIKFCLLVEGSRLQNAAFVDKQAEIMAEAGYLKVLDDRPVLYLGFLSEAEVKRLWGDVQKLRQVLDAFRTSVRRKGLNDPYIVLMDFNPAAGKRWMDDLGCQAISSYATSAGGEAAPYRALAEHTERFWDACKATGAQVVPIIMSGWDRRPRVARPMPWETWQKPGVGIEKYYKPPTPDELAQHVSRAMQWLSRNRESALAQLSILYAWNENDEGGWLVPTLHQGTARLDAIARVLRKTPTIRSKGSPL